MTEMNKRMVNMSQTLETKLNSISAGVGSLRADVAGLQALQPILLVQPSLIRRGDSPSKPSLHLLFLLDLQVQSRWANGVISWNSAHNEASKFMNSHIDDRHAPLYTLRYVENEEIDGFPLNISAVDRLSCGISLILVYLCSTILIQGSLRNIAHFDRV